MRFKHARPVYRKQNYACPKQQHVDLWSALSTCRDTKFCIKEPTKNIDIEVPFKYINSKSLEPLKSIARAQTKQTTSGNSLYHLQNIAKLYDI